MLYFVLPLQHCECFTANQNKLLRLISPVCFLHTQLHLQFAVSCIFESLIMFYTFMPHFLEILLTVEAVGKSHIQNL